MAQDLRQALHRARPHLVEDAIGAAALVVLLLGALLLPGLI